MTAGQAPRIAGAPISWGVCEVPGWGWQYPPATVLDEMREVGLAATEFGPDGFLPTDPAARAATLRSHGLAAVGGFLPVLLHDPDHDPVPALRAELDAFVAAGADTMVLAAATGQDGYDARPELDPAGWTTLLNRLGELAEVIRARELTPCLHPHVGTMVESTAEVGRVLNGSGIGLCLDTGHLLIGGTDPADLVRSHPHRIVHAHLKDVDADRADQVRAGALTYTDAVRGGLYRPLGDGDVDIAGVVRSLEAVGYRGWYVLEQDTILPTDPATDPDGTPAPIHDVRRSLAYLHSVTPGPA